MSVAVAPCTTTTRSLRTTPLSVINQKIIPSVSQRGSAVRSRGERRDVPSSPWDTWKCIYVGHAGHADDARSQRVTLCHQEESPMIRRPMQRGLLAAIAVVALFPVAASAADGGAPAPGTYTASSRVSTPGRHSRLPQISTPARSMTGRRHPAPHRHADPSYTAKHGRHTAGQPRHTTAVGHSKGRVTARHACRNVRTGPGTRYRIAGSMRQDGPVTITCKKKDRSGRQPLVRARPPARLRHGPVRAQPQPRPVVLITT